MGRRLVLSDAEVLQLHFIASSRSRPYSIIQRAQIVLACGAGETKTSIAKRMGLTGMTVGKWLKRYRQLGLDGLHDELRPPADPAPTRTTRSLVLSTGPCRASRPMAALTGAPGLWLRRQRSH